MEKVTFVSVFFCTFVLLVANAVPPEPIEKWEWRYPVPRSLAYHGITWTGEEFLAVGDEETIIGSPDGESWEIRHTTIVDSPYDPEPPGLRCIAVNGEVMVAGGSQGTIFTSTNGWSWSRYEADFPEAFISAVWSGQMFYLLAESGILLSSTDGNNWSKEWVPEMVGLASDGNRLVGVTSSGESYSSGNAAQWWLERDFDLGEDVAFTGVRWVSDHFVITGGHVSEGVSNESPQVFIVTSPDGWGWDWTIEDEEARDTFTAYYDSAGDDMVQVAIGEANDHAAMLVRDNQGTWMEIREYITGPMLSIAFDGNRFVAMGAKGNIIVSESGTDWRLASSGHHPLINELIWDGAKFVAVGRGGSIFLSETGYEWRKAQTWGSSSYHAVATSGQRLLVIGDKVVKFSDDGTNWNNHYLPSGGSFNGLTWIHGRFIAVGDWGRIATSDTGDSWSLVVLPEAFEINTVAGNDKIIVAAGQAGRNAVSLDGETWTMKTPLGTRHIKQVIWGKDMFMALSPDTIYISQDGIEWVTVLEGEGYSPFAAVAWNGECFMVVGHRNFVSEDGTTWNEVERAGTSVSRVAGNVDQFIVVTWDGMLGKGGPPSRIDFADWAESLDLPASSRDHWDRNGPLNIMNLLSYALGIDPMHVQAEELPFLKPKAEGRTGAFHFHRSRRSQNIHYVVERSSDLLNWQEIPEIQWQIVDVKATHEVIGIPSVSADKAQFFRLKVSVSPE